MFIVSLSDLRYYNLIISDELTKGLLMQKGGIEKSTDDARVSP